MYVSFFLNKVITEFREIDQKIEIKVISNLSLSKRKIYYTLKNKQLFFRGKKNKDLLKHHISLFFHP